MPQGSGHITYTTGKHGRTSASNGSVKSGKNGVSVSDKSSVAYQEATSGMNISRNIPPHERSGLAKGEHRERYYKYQRGRREKALKGQWPAPQTPRDLKH